MTKENVIQILPQWFDGNVYEEGGEVTNPYSGCGCWLNAKELSIYDFIKGAEAILESGVRDEELITSFYEGLWWFKDNNIEAYMILLDQYVKKYYTESKIHFILYYSYTFKFTIKNV